MTIKKIPDQLKEEGLFCLWRYEERKGRQTKVPYNAKTGDKAQSNNPSTFAPLSVAEAVQSNYDGIGVGIFGDLCAIDIDDCVGEDERLSELALDVIYTMNSYTEFSPSGKGIHILFKAPGFPYDKTKYFINNRKSGLEIYVARATSKYITMTGNAFVSDMGIGVRTEELQTILDKYMLRDQPKQQVQNSPDKTTLFSESYEDDQLIKKAMGAKNGIASSKQIYKPDNNKTSLATDVDDHCPVSVGKNLTKLACNVDSRKVPWLVEGFIIQGTTTGIQGLPGSGKSFLTCKLAVEVANGGEFPRADGTMMRLEPGNVLLANFDDSLEFGIKPRLESMGLTAAGAKRISFLDPTGAAGITFDDPRLAAVFEEVKPVLAIFDTLQHFIGGKVDLHRANETNVAMTQLKLLAEKYNTAVVIVQHISKNAAGGNGGASVLWGLGSTAINGLFRSVWTVGKVQGEDETLRAAVSSKNNLLPYDPPAIQYSLSQSKGFQWCGVSREITARDLIRGDGEKNTRGRPAGPRDEAVEFIRQELMYGKVKASELFRSAEAKGLSVSTIKRAKPRLGVKTFQEGRKWYWDLPTGQKSEA
jgi:hypothetical protein